MPSASVSETKIRTRSGESLPLTRAAVAVAALDAAEYTAHGHNDFWVMAHIGGRLVPVVPLVRLALGGQEPYNTNEAEMRLRELGFRIFVARLYDPAGKPVTLTQDQLKGARP